jgi:hypothetical protein
MTEFESWKQYGEFRWFVMRTARHLMDAKNQRFLDAVIHTSASRKDVIEKGRRLWRAQLGSDWRAGSIRVNSGRKISFHVEEPFPRKRMKPQPDRAPEGRVNPKGIPCLYFSTDMETAMTETRPLIDACISVAQFVMLKDLRVVDCSAASRELSPPEPDREPEPDMREAWVWSGINRAFSKPATRTDDVAEYAPTQVLAEAFRSAGYDAIIYGSKLGIGRTVAVFDLAAAELVECRLYRVEGVSLKFSSAAKPYYVDKYCDTDEQKESGAPGMTTEGQAAQGEN